jgi:hypothetical protein
MPGCRHVFLMVMLLDPGRDMHDIEPMSEVRLHLESKVSKPHAEGHKGGDEEVARCQNILLSHVVCSKTNEAQTLITFCRTCTE